MSQQPIVTFSVLLLLLAGCTGAPPPSEGPIEFYLQLTNGTPRAHSVQVLLASEGGRHTIIDETFYMEPHSKTMLTSYNATDGDLRVLAEIDVRSVEEHLDLRHVDPATHRGQGIYIHVRDARLWVDLVQFPHATPHEGPDERGAV